MDSSLQDRPRFDALLALLPPHRRDEPAGAWDIGEQEGALAGLTEALAETRTAVSELTRARIAVLAEAWGCWDALSGQVAALPRDEDDATGVAVIEHSDEGHDITAAITRDLADENLWPGHTAIAWIACRRCHDVLVRIHETMPWGPSLIPSTYAIVRTRRLPQHPQTHTTFDSGATALTALTQHTTRGLDAATQQTADPA